MDQSVPSWSDLLRDVTILAKNQRQCYRDVHHLLNTPLANLDHKIMSLMLDRTNSNKNNLNSTKPMPERVRCNNFTSTPKEKLQPIRQDRPIIKNNPIPKPMKSVTIEPNPPRKHQTAPIRRQLEEEIPISQGLFRAKGISNGKVSPGLQVNPKIDDFFRNSPTPDEPLETKRCSKARVRETEDDIRCLHQLKLPLPLSEYFRQNRPYLVARAEERASQLKHRAEIRRLNESAKLAEFLERFKLSKKNNDGRSRHKPEPIKTPNRDYTFITHDNPVRQYNLTERQIRKQTSKKYKSLPEVKRKETEELRNIMKLQYYKNKQQYGKKLLENRRRGVLNYPLIATSDDVSLSSYQDDSLSGQFDQVVANEYNTHSMI